MISVPKAELITVQRLLLPSRKCQSSPASHTESLGEDTRPWLSNCVVHSWVNEQHDRECIKYYKPGSASCPFSPHSFSCSHKKRGRAEILPLKASSFRASSPAKSWSFHKGQAQICASQVNTKGNAMRKITLRLKQPDFRPLHTKGGSKAHQGNLAGCLLSIQHMHPAVWKAHPVLLQGEAIFSAFQATGCLKMLLPSTSIISFCRV